MKQASLTQAPTTVKMSKKGAKKDRTKNQKQKKSVGSEKKRKTKVEIEVPPDATDLSESEGEGESESFSDAEDFEKGHEKGMLKIHKQRSISMNSLLQDFFAKMDNQAKEPALSLVTTPPSRTPTIQGLQEFNAESGSDESVFLLPRSPNVFLQTSDNITLTRRSNLPASSEDMYTSHDDDELSSYRQSSGSGSFPVVPHVLSGAHERLSVTSVGSFGSEEDSQKVVSKKKKSLKEASSHYVSSGADMVSSTDSSDWSDDEKKGKEANHTIACESQETNAYGGAFGTSPAS